MLKFLQRLLGWDSHTASSKPERVERRQTPRTSAASVLAQDQPQAAEDSQPAAAKEPEKASEPTLSLQDPDINLEEADKADADGSNPYDTGSFNRPNAWSNAGGRKNI